MEEKDLIALLRSKDRKAQKVFYERYAPKMFGVSLRYIKNEAEAEDVLIEAFYKVLTKIDNFHGNGSFEGWVRRIVVNQSLMQLRKNNHFHLSIENAYSESSAEYNADLILEANDILSLLKKLSPGYRTVFNLYVLEGYKHREVAEMLGISINTSKSQLILARKKLQEMLKDLRV